MEEKKKYTKPEIEVVEFMYSATLLEGSCNGAPCPDEIGVEQ